jgi:hypothetical protein
MQPPPPGPDSGSWTARADEGASGLSMASPVYVYEQLKPYLNCDGVGRPGGGGGQNPIGQGTQGRPAEEALNCNVDSLFDAWQTGSTPAEFTKLVDECDPIDLSIPKARLKTLIEDEHCDVDTTDIVATVGQSSSGGSTVLPPTSDSGIGHRRLERRRAQVTDIIFEPDSKHIRGQTITNSRNIRDKLSETNTITNHCSLPEIEARIAVVDSACCDTDDPSDVCQGGPPASCDFECSNIWLPLWNDCQSLLEMLFQSRPGAAAQFRALTATCEVLPPQCLAISDPEPLSRVRRYPTRSGKFTQSLEASRPNQ